MIELYLQRRLTVLKTTIGALFEGETFQCYTLEDVVREVPGQPVEAWKIAGETAIPVGRYRLDLVVSSRFGPDTLAVLDVPGFDLIRIHSGNDDADTHGCILVGQQIANDPTGDGGNLVNSRVALAALKNKIVPAIRDKQDAVWLTIFNLATS